MSAKPNDSIHSFQALGKLHQLVSAEVKLATKEASDSMNQLTKTFMDMVKDVHEILAQVEQLDVKAGDTGKAAIKQTCDTFLDKVQAGTIGFQFYDKLTQRLYHASKTLTTADQSILEDKSFADPKIWSQVWQDMQGRYNTEQDRQMHQLVMEGKSVKDALNLAEKSGNKTDVELF